MAALWHEVWTHVFSVPLFLDQPFGSSQAPLHQYELIKSKVCAKLHGEHLVIIYPHSCHWNLESIQPRIPSCTALLWNTVFSLGVQLYAPSLLTDASSIGIVPAARNVCLHHMCSPKRVQSVLSNRQDCATIVYRKANDFFFRLNSLLQSWFLEFLSRWWSSSHMLWLTCFFWAG